MLLYFINLDKWNELPQTYKRSCACGRGAAHDVDAGQVRRGEPEGAARLVAAGAKLRAVPAAGDGGLLQRRQRALCRDLGARTPSSRRSTSRWWPFRNEEDLWFRVAENTFDNFMVRQPRASKL